MQLLPSTGRRVARQEGIRRFSTTKLFDPETNVRLGMRYYAGLLNRLGSDHLALASYNAGASRVARWRAEKPGLPSEEFIDDIPFPETQNYVKRILGTAEDYRRLYAGSVASTKGSEPPARASVPASNRKAKPARPVPKR
jgi:soluble lytic murein transglycosylase